MSSLVDSAAGPAVLARGGSSGPAIANAPAAAIKLPAELHHRFRFIAIDASLLAEAEGGAAALLDALLAMGVRVAIFAGGDALTQLWAFFVFPLAGGVLGVLAWWAVRDRELDVAPTAIDLREAAELDEEREREGAIDISSTTIVVASATRLSSRGATSVSLRPRACARGGHRPAGSARRSGAGARPG